MAEFWEQAVRSATAEPLSEDMLFDAAAAIAGDLSPDLRDKYRWLAVEARADAFVRTLHEIRDLNAQAKGPDESGPDHPSRT